jgi:RecB family exonuclease
VQLNPEIVLSPSQANTFLSCGAKWYFRYAMELPDPAGAGLVRGKAVHGVVEYAMRAKIDGYELEPGAVSDAYDDAWERAADGAQFNEYDDVDAIKTSGSQLAGKWLREAAPYIEPAACEVPVAGEIGGVRVRGIVDILDTSGRVIDLKTASRKPSGLSADHALQLATYAALTPGASGEARIDTLVSTKDPQLILTKHTPGAAGQRLVERIYPLVAEGIAGGLFTPNRNATTCNRRYCSFWRECEREYGGCVE